MTNSRPRTPAPVAAEISTALMLSTSTEHHQVFIHKLAHFTQDFIRALTGIMLCAIADWWFGRQPTTPHRTSQNFVTLQHISRQTLIRDLGLERVIVVQRGLVHHHWIVHDCIGNGRW